MASPTGETIVRPRSSESSSAQRKKYRSPEPIATSSMTPPPSSQLPPASQPARTPTPTNSQLSSPPPTILKTARSSSAIETGLYTSEQVADASAEELRDMISDITTMYREARASAAHQSLQYNLLCMESNEMMKRMQVELDMAQKEVEVSQTRQQQSVPMSNILATPVMSAHPSPAEQQQLMQLRRQCQALEAENNDLRLDLSDLKSLMLEREHALAEENDRLRKRIRANRDHAELIRRSSSAAREQSIYSTPVAASGRHGQSLAQSSSRYATPKQREERGNFDVLLMAGEVLSGKADTTPSTPTGFRAANHTRGAHSLSSMPTTPQQARTAPPLSRRTNHVQAYPDSPLGSRTAPRPTQRQQTRRRESRDSTISASDVGDSVPVAVDTDDIAESHASQEATSMLRKSAEKSFGSAAAESSGLLQSKLYGKVSKAGAHREQDGKPDKKRKATEDGGRKKSSKKGKADEGVGLGIGGWTPRPSA